MEETAPSFGKTTTGYHGLNGTVRGQRRIPSNLQKYIAEITEDKTNADD